MSWLDNLMGRIGRRYWLLRIHLALGRAWEQGFIDSWLLHELDHRMKYAKRLDVPYPPRPRYAQQQIFTPEEARALWQVGSRTPGSVASEPLESALAKLLPMAEADGARRHYHGIGCDWVRNHLAPRPPRES